MGPAHERLTGHLFCPAAPSEDGRPADLGFRGGIEERGFYTENFHSAAWLFRGDDGNPEGSPRSLSRAPGPAAGEARGDPGHPWWVRQAPEGGALAQGRGAPRAVRAPARGLRGAGTPVVDSEAAAIPVFSAQSIVVSPFKVRGKAIEEESGLFHSTSKK